MGIYHPSDIDFNGTFGHLFADCRQTAIFADHSSRYEALEGSQNTLCRWRCDPFKLHQIVDAERFKLEYGSGHICTSNFWRGGAGQRLEGEKWVQTVADSP